MKILSCCTKGYFGRGGAIDPTHVAFTDGLRAMGHEVDHFDHYVSKRKIGTPRTGELFLEKVRRGHYDAIIYHTIFQDPAGIEPSVREAGRYAPTIAWNSDDEWKWEQKSSRMAPFFTFMFTTSPLVYEQNRVRFPNLRLSQWACLDGYGDFHRPKDLDFTFAGHVFGERIEATRTLARRAGLRAFGHMSGRVTQPELLYWPWIRKVTFRFPAIYGRSLRFEELHEIWNRSRISYTPMECIGADILQIKARTFEQALSGTLMICRQSPYLERYYEPGKEFVPFDDLDDCVDKVKFYLAHESERARIAKAYHDRTRAEHMWTHRFQKMFDEIGLRN